MIYYGEEVARPGGDWPDNRSDMPWGDRESPPGSRRAARRGAARRLQEADRASAARTRRSRAGRTRRLATDGDLYVFVRRDAAIRETPSSSPSTAGSAPATLKMPVPGGVGRGAIPKTRGAAASCRRSGGTIETVDRAAVGAAS